MDPLDRVTATLLKNEAGQKGDDLVLHDMVGLIIGGLLGLLWVGISRRTRNRWHRAWGGSGRRRRMLRGLCEVLGQIHIAGPEVCILVCEA